MDIETILYLLIGIGWFLFNAYRKSQQNKQPEAPKQRRTAERREEPVVEETKPEPQEEYRSLEDMIFDQLSGKRQEPEKPKPEPVPVKKEEKGFLDQDLTHQHLKEGYEMGSGEMGSHRVQRQVRRLDVVEEQEESLMDTLLPNGFDLRQAVVLNAILDRPYK